MSAPEVTEAVVADADDKAVETFKAKFAKSYGVSAAVGAIPWDVILAALMSLLGGCNLNNSADVKKESKRPLARARMLAKLWSFGVPMRDRQRAVDATIAAIEQSSDAEVASYLTAARDAG